MTSLTFSFNPTQTQLDKIETWLQAEYLKSNKGFYVNWQNSVLHSHGLNRMLIALKDDEPIGFMTWHPDNERVAEIQITEIKPGSRRNGYARQLLKALTDHLTATGICVFTLHCQPSASEKAWKKLGFVKFPDVGDFDEENDPDGEHLYQILCPYLSPNKAGTTEDAITLWAAEPWEVDIDSPAWNWHPTFKDGTNEFIVPIIYPAKRDWKIRWSKYGVTINENKVKYFQSTEIDFSDFIVITHLG